MKATANVQSASKYLADFRPFLGAFCANMHIFGRLLLKRLVTLRGVMLLPGKLVFLCLHFDLFLRQLDDGDFVIYYGDEDDRDDIIGQTNLDFSRQLLMQQRVERK